MSSSQKKQGKNGIIRVVMPSLRVLDVVLFFFFLSLVVVSVFVSAADDGEALSAEIETVDGRYILPLSREAKLSVDGPVGKTLIRVRDGSVYVHDSDCKDKICIAMGEIDRPGGWVACLPNRVLVRVIAEQGSESSESVDSGAF